MPSRRTNEAAEKAAVTVMQALFGSLGSSMIDLVAAGAEEAGLYTPPRRKAQERLKRLDDAREALRESLEAIDELEEEAAKTQKRQAAALQALEATLQSHDTAEQKLANIQTLLNVEISTLREAVGVPDVKKERMIGCVTGIGASLVAAAVIWLGQLLVKHGPAVWQSWTAG